MTQKIIFLKRMLWAPPLITFFCAISAAFFWNKINHVNATLTYKTIHISPPITAFISWAFFLFSLFFILFGFISFFALLLGKRKIIINNHSIFLPKLSFSGFSLIEVPFTAIKKIELFNAANGLFLNIHHSMGITSLAKYAFKSNTEFDELQNILKNKLSI